MLTTCSQRPRGVPGFRKSAAPVVSSMIAVLIWSGLVSPVRGEERIPAAPSGFMMGAYGHDDLWLKTGCGLNFTMEPGVFFDQLGHGTHVLATIAGSGSADSRYRGVAPGVGLPYGGGIRAAKIWDKTNTGQDSWMEAAMDWMAIAGECDNTPAPLVINISGGSAGTGLTGTDSRSKKARLQGLDQPPAVRGRGRQRGIDAPDDPESGCREERPHRRQGGGQRLPHCREDRPRQQPRADRRRPHEAEHRGARPTGHFRRGGHRRHH